MSQYWVVSMVSHSSTHVQAGEIFQLKSTHSEYTHLIVTATSLALLNNHVAEVDNWLHNEHLLIVLLEYINNIPVLAI